LIAQVIFLLERGQTRTYIHTQTFRDASDHLTHVSATAGLSNDPPKRINTPETFTWVRLLEIFTIPWPRRNCL